MSASLSPPDLRTTGRNRSRGEYEDKALDPRLLRKMAERIGAPIVEVEASHVLFLTQPKGIADVID